MGGVGAWGEAGTPTARWSAPSTSAVLCAATDVAQANRQETSPPGNPWSSAPADDGGHWMKEGWRTVAAVAAAGLWVAGLMTVGVAVVTINAMNFVDGLDGLAARLGSPFFRRS